MNTKHKPATALPAQLLAYAAIPEVLRIPGLQNALLDAAAKLHHQDNAYPELVEALRHALAAAALLNETAKSPGVEQRFQKGLALLQKLGEA